MNTTFSEMIDRLTATTPEHEDYTARTVYCTAASAISRKKPILRRTRPLSLAVTATRQSATAREPPARNGKPPRNGKSTLTP